jgi:GTP:adenosylcobinamide-phosphate guanylyltransferase
MYAIVTAGGIPEPGEPLYEFTRGACKALLDIAGKPMIQWVLDALSGAQTIEGVVVVGLPDGSNVICSKPVHFLSNQGDMLENLRAGLIETLKLNPQAQFILAVSSDIPAVTSEMVDWIVNTAMQTDHDAYYNVITRQVMEARYPSSKRSYVRLRDVEVCGGDMHVIRTMTVTANDNLWKRIIASRKNALKQAALIGYDTLFLLFFHLITLEQAVRLASRRLKISGRAIVCPYAEIGMDIDKPFQYEQVRDDLARRVLA